MKGKYQLVIIKKDLEIRCDRKIYGSTLILRDEAGTPLQKMREMRMLREDDIAIALLEEIESLEEIENVVSLHGEKIRIRKHRSAKWATAYDKIKQVFVNYEKAVEQNRKDKRDSYSVNTSS